MHILYPTTYLAIGVFLAAFAPIWFVTRHNQRKDYYDRYRASQFKGDWLTWLYATLCTAIATIGVTGLVVGAINISVTHRDEYTSMDVISLQDGSALSGRFFLGSGNVGDEARYTFYTQVGTEVSLRNVKADEVRVYQDAPAGKAWVTSLDSCTLEPNWAPCLMSPGPFSALHIPPNTVRTGLVLDAK